MKEKSLKTLRDIGVILLGSAIYAVAFNWLFLPNRIVMGGFTGLAQTVNYLLPWVPIGLFITILNIPLFIIGIRLQGARLLWSSLFAMLSSSLMIDLLDRFVTFRPMQDQVLACLFGGALLGLSMGILLLVGATTGGKELAARLLKMKFRHISIGKLCLAIDLAVVALYTLTFRVLDEALYAVAAMYISSIAMDGVVYGRKTSKVACVICTKGDEVQKRLLELDFGVTALSGKGGYTSAQKNVIICAFKPSRIAALKKTVIEMDPDAFVIVCDAQEVFGEGFAECSLNGL